MSLLFKLNRSRFAVGVVAMIAVVVVGGIVWGFGRQLAYARQMRLEESRLEQLVADESAYHDGLVEQLEYVQSEASVERWAREEAMMSQPGEVVVVVLRDFEASSGEGTHVDDEQSTLASEAEERPFWVEWWELIFDRN